MSDKTEEPTPRRQQRALEQGDAPVSATLAQAVGLVVALALLPAMLGLLASRAADGLRAALRGETAAPLAVALDVILPCAPVLAAVAATATLVTALQTRGTLAWSRLSPDLARLDVIAGLGRLFSRERLSSVLRALVGAAAAGALAVHVVRGGLGAVAASAGDAGKGAAAASLLVSDLVWAVALLGLAVAGADALVVRGAWLRRLRMSKDEVRREHREAEGDPQLKHERRRAHRELLDSATLSAVKEATVVIANPIHLCTALRYDRSDDAAPRVVAQGEGELARAMVAAAERWGVPVVRDVEVARALRELQQGDEIPEALYEAVAAILRELHAVSAEE